MPKANTIRQTEEFSEWMAKLKDRKGRSIINARIAAAETGNFGDCEPVGDGVSEMRVHFGPGYRMYLKQVASVVYVLLCGGSKGSQKKDIQKAKQMAKEL
jgi:putative addiction module killer protein